MSSHTSRPSDLSDRLPTERIDALPSGANPGMLEMHRAIANRLLREGAPARAFTELVRATREGPMSARLAAVLTQIALQAGTFSAAARLLSQGLDEVEGAERIGVRRALARLYRRGDDLELAREQLAALLKEDPGDRRARRTLNALFEREERWDELDASLEKETDENIRRGSLRSASRAALKRARLWDERLGDVAKAALRYGQAAQFAEQGGDDESCFLLRLLWLRSLHRSQAPQRAKTEAIDAALKVGVRVGKAERVQAMISELQLGNSEPLPTPTQRTRSTQIELMAVAAEAEKAGRTSEVAALLRAAIDEGPDPQVAQRLEAHLIARGAWRQLAQFYRDQAVKARGSVEKAQWKEKLAELLESELSDVRGAANAWAEVVELTGDQRAVKEQVRLHAKRKDAHSVRRALDEGVSRAVVPPAKAQALVARGEEALTRGEKQSAADDFEAALAEAPLHPAALAGLAELAAAQRQTHFIGLLEVALKKLPRRQSGRGELYRRLGRLVDASEDPLVARFAWEEVLFELPEDEEALGRLSVLARSGGSSAQLEAALRNQISKHPRGPATREARLELVGLLERAHRADEALTELRQSVRYEPGHQQAWLVLADRLEQRGIWPEAAWALEHGTTATSDSQLRVQLWMRLSRLVAERLGDTAKAQVYQKRADKLQRELLEEESSGSRPSASGPLSPPPTDLTPIDPPKRVPPVPVLVWGEDETWEPASPVSHHHGLAAANLAQPEEWEAPASVQAVVPPTPARPSTVEIPSVPEAGASSPSFALSPAKVLIEEREQLFARVRGAPLDSDGYRMLAEHFDTASDPSRSSLMLEIARALEGDPHAAPRAPKMILSATDRAGLKHPVLRGEEGELLGLCGLALCRIYPTRGSDAGTREEFRVDSGKGAKGAAEALLAAVRILGLRAPEVYPSQESGPPFSLVFPGSPRLLVGRLAIKRELPEAELRFFAGRALFTQNPDLLCLRYLRREQLVGALGVLAQVLRGQSLTAEARSVRDGLPPKGWERLKQLNEKLAPKLNLALLAAGARHSANRAGLVVCGSVAPAIAALRTKKALSSEMIELVRFAASERYLMLRSRQL